MHSHEMDKECGAHAPVYTSVCPLSGFRPGPKQIIVTRESFFCGSCCFLQAVEWTSTGGLCDGLYSTVILSHCSKVDDFFPSYRSRSQDFLRVKTSESFTWFTTSRKEGCCCPCQFLGCSYSGQVSPWAVLLSWWENSLRSLEDCQESLTIARGWQGRRRNPPVLDGHGDQIAQAMPFWSALKVAWGWLRKNPQCQASKILFASKYELIMYLIYAFKTIFHPIVFLFWFEGFF